MKETLFSAFRSSVVSWDLINSFRARCFASLHSSLSQDIKTRRFFAAHSFFFLFSFCIDHSSFFCSDLRSSSFINHRWSSIAVLRLCMRHQHLQSCVITNSWSFNRFFLALLEHCSLSSKSSNKQQNHALFIFNTFTLSENCLLSLFFWLLFDSIEDDSCLRRAERLSTLISTALDHWILTSLS